MRDHPLLRSFIAALGLVVFMLVPVTQATAFELTHSAAPAQELSQAQETGLGIRLLDIPALTQKDPRARSYIVDHLKPGTTIERRVQVTNGTDSSQSVKIYPGAARIQDDSFYGEDGPAENELTRWISTEQTQVELTPGEVMETLVTIAVPEDAPESEQYAIIWAEIRSAPGEGTKVATASRVGVRVYLSVGPGNGPPANFNIGSLTPGRNSEGSPEVTTTVTNTGGRALDITGTLMLSEGPGGLSAGPNAITKGTTIAPGESAPLLVTLPAELPSGPWKAKLELVSGLVTHEASATIIFPDAGAGTVVAPDESFNIIWIIGGVSVLILTGGATLWWIRRRNRAQI